MLDIDILTAFVICGAASCVAAVMTALARAPEPHLAAALRICSAGFGVLGLSLVQLVGGVDGPAAWPMVVTVVGTSCGVALFAWGLARLTGERVPTALVPIVLLAIVAAHLVAVRQGAWALGLTYVCTITLASVLTAVALRRFIRRPQNVAERILGLAMAGFAASWVLRLGLTLQYEGPVLVHHVYVPPGLARALGILYGVMPIFLATVLLSAPRAGLRPARPPWGSSRLGAARRRLESMLNARLARQLELRALTDELTGAMTRRALRELAPQQVARAQAKGNDVAVMMVDIDHFKAINDERGHLAGDDVLRELAALLRAQLRQDALVTRFGGEEFALLVPLRGVPVARRVAERLREAIADHGFVAGGARVPVTASIGLALVGPGEAVDAALQRADEALYRAKRAGRDRVETSLDLAA